MANQYKNKVVYNGTTLIDLTDTTAVQSDVASGKYFYTASGQRVQGTGQGGSSGYTRTVIVPQQTVTPTYESGGGINGYTVDLSSVITEPLAEWSEYIVTFNGTEYFSTATLMWGSNVLIGDVNWFWGGSDLPYPFGILYYNGECTLAVGSGNALTVKIEKLELTGGGGGSSPWETVYSGTVDVVNAESGHYYGWINPWSEPIEQNSVWKITWNGVAYECTATWEGSSDGNPYAIGNYTIDGGQGGDDIPFLLQPYYGTHLIVLSETSGSYTVAIQKQVSGSSGGVITETVMDATITATDQDTSGYVTWVKTQWIDYMSETLVDDTNYIVTIDGTPYLCHANAVYGGGDIYCGDTEIVWGTPANSIYPFAIGSYASGNVQWMIGDTQPHSVKVEKVISMSGGGSSDATLITKTITENGTYSASDDNADGYSSVTVNITPPVTWETMADQTCTITTYDGMRIVTINGYNEPLSADETYRVTWGDNQYICNTIVDTAEFTQDGYLFGNISIFGSQYEDTGEPFVFYRTSSTRMTGVTNDTTSSSVYVKIEKQVPASSGGITPTGTVSITTNGTHDVTNYASASVSVTPNLQSKSATPTTSSQTVSPDSGYDGLSSVTVGAIPSQYVVPTGNKAITENGNNIDVAEYATVSVSVSGSSKNVQTVQSTSRRNNTALGSIISLTCSKAGTYDVYWTCARSNTSQTWGSRLYINGSAYDSENTTWSNNVQNNHLTNVVLSANDTVAVYGRSRSGYYIHAPQLTIMQTA